MEVICKDGVLLVLATCLHYFVCLTLYDTGRGHLGGLEMVQPLLNLSEPVYMVMFEGVS